jgi:hypothetical protein
MRDEEKAAKGGTAMRQWMWRTWLLTALGVGLTAGCKGTTPQPAYPPDPYLLSRKPVEGRLPANEPAPLALREPAAPAAPLTALASAPVDPERFGQIGLAGRPRPPRPAVLPPPATVADKDNKTAQFARPR